MSLSAFDIYKLMVKMQWDRVDSSFFGVLLTTLFRSPRNRQLRASYYESHLTAERLVKYSS